MAASDRDPPRCKSLNKQEMKKIIDFVKKITYIIGNISSVGVSVQYCFT